MRYVYIKDLETVKRELKEQYDKAWAMRYAVKAFIKSLEGFENKAITQRALQEYYYKKDKLTRYVIDEDNYITFSLGGDVLNRRQLKIQGKKGANYNYYNDVAYAYEISLYDGEKYKVWQDVIDELKRIMDTLKMPWYDEDEIAKEYAKCAKVAEDWNNLAMDENNIWNSVER